MNAPPRASKRGGFSLIELLVALSVLSVLVVLLFGLVESATRLWRDTENRVDAFREARAALAVISGELRNFCATTNPDFFSTNALGNTAAGADATGLYFLTRLPPTAQGENLSDLCVVGYERRWARQSAGVGQTNAADPGREGFHLFRSFHGSGLTYARLRAGTPPLADLQVPEGSGAPRSEILARNILRLEIRCFATNPVYTNSADAYLAWTYSTNNPTPQMIEINLTAISDETARKLGGQTSRWSTNEPLVAREARTFSARIALPDRVVHP